MDGDQQRRVIGLSSAIFMIVGMMVGSGIFSAPSPILNYVGSPLAALVIWLSAGLISLFGALSYAELGTILSENGGELTYLSHTFGKPAGFVFSTVSCLIGKPSSNAIILIVFAEYAFNFIPKDYLFEQLEFQKKLTAFLLCIFLTLLNFRTETGVKVQNVTSILKLITIVSLIAYGFYKGFTTRFGNITYESFVGGSSLYPQNILMALYQAFWSYEGWNCANFIAGEIKNPQKNLPSAIFISVQLVTVIYLLVNFSFFIVIPLDIIKNSPAVGEQFALDSQIIQNFVTFGILVATLSSANASIYTAARLVETASIDNLMPSFLQKTYNNVPVRALSLQCLLTIIFILSGSYKTLVTFYSQTMWVFYTFTVICVLILRFRSPEKFWVRPYKNYTLFVVIFIIFGIVFVITPLIVQTKSALIAYGLLLLALLVYHLKAFAIKLFKRNKSYQNLNDLDEQPEQFQLQ